MLTLDLFGPPRIARDGSEVRFDTRKAPAVLAVLAVTGRGHTRDELAGMLWPDLDRTRARGALRRTLSVAAAAGPALVTERDIVMLDAERTRCDVVEFGRLVEAPDVESWRAAAELATAPFLAGFSLRDSPVFDDWQIATADALRDAASQNLGRLVARAVDAGDLQLALTYARRRVRIEPLSEPAHADVIRVAAWSGDRPGALTAYRALVRQLDRELGVTPLPETMALHAAVRAGTLARLSTPPVAEVAEEPSRGRRALVGRDALLRRFTWPMAGDAGAAFGVVGDAGLGKTAMLDELVAQAAARDVPVVQLGGHLAERALAFATAHDLLRALLAVDVDLAAKLGPAARPLAGLAPAVGGTPEARIRGPADLDAVHDAVREALGAVAARGALLVIDDAHLIDEPSAALLAYCVRRLPAGLLLVAAWPAAAAGAPLPVAVADAGAVLTASPLDMSAVTAIVAGTGHDAIEVMRRTRGVPLLVLEYATSGEATLEGAPAQVRDVVGARFDAAPPTTRQVVAAAAVIGTVADPELLRVASGRDEGETVDAIEEAVERGLLVERADRAGYDVPHEYAREAALARLSLARERLLHGRVAEVLARRHALDPLATPAGAVARHLAAAAKDADAAAWYVSAARESSRLYAHAEALEHLNAARSHGALAVDVDDLMGASLVRLGRYADALVSLDRAAALAEDDPARQAAIEHAIAGVHDRLGDTALASAHLEAARDLLEGGPGRARVLGDLALVQHRRGDDDQAMLTAETAARVAADVGDERALVQADNVIGVIEGARGDHEAARRRLTTAVERARSTGDLDLVIATSNNLSRVVHAAGDQDAALAAAEDAVAVAERQGDRHRLAALYSHVADLLHDVGRDEEAVTYLQRSAAAFGDVQGAESTPAVWTLTEW